MLTLLAAASMTLFVPQAPQALHAQADSLQQDRQDTVQGERSVTILRSGMFREMPGFRTPEQFLFGSARTIQGMSSSALDSLLRSQPSLRAPLLKELLIPEGQPLEDPSQVALRKFNEQLIKDSKLTPFERMSLIARRQADLYRYDNSIRWYQLDIIGTVRWLEEVLK
jgi:hypothetical protein